MAIPDLLGRGGSVISEAQTMPNGLSFGYVANPDGAVLGIWCPPG